MNVLTSYASPNFDDRKCPVCGIVIHYTEEELDDTIRIFLDDKCEKRVSSHYVIDRDGTVYLTVSEMKRAWHAGVGFWAGITDLNAVTIGIELVHLPHEDYDQRQILSLIELCHDIKSRHDIKWVIGHSDCAFQRGKVDPGPRFPWKMLACAGIGIWPAWQPPASSLGNSELLRRIGYNVEDEAAAMAAFALHFCPGYPIDSSAVRKQLEAVYAMGLGKQKALAVR